MLYLLDPDDAQNCVLNGVSASLSVRCIESIAPGLSTLPRGPAVRKPSQAAITAVRQTIDSWLKQHWPETYHLILPASQRELIIANCMALHSVDDLQAVLPKVSIPNSAIGPKALELLECIRQALLQTANQHGSERALPGTMRSLPGTMRSLPGTTHPTPGTIHSTPGTMHSTPGTMHSTPGTIHSTPGTMRSLPGTMHSALGTMHSTPGTIHSTPGTMHPTPGTMRSLPGTMHSTPGTIHSTPGTMQSASMPRTFNVVQWIDEGANWPFRHHSFPSRTPAGPIAYEFIPYKPPRFDR
ncbi:hypothetical protein FN846DRAFT_885617 [Sphaerosporella brunnea]|uniref:Uncharacterized protein n=1 Tax=Sphaerosporella brunnea TaxID=1250544 RepID=A0A5J5FCK7_9PEZI|nr:hypothetical protein FN846DRAFT_885617 [Sphaerosporella brunnea]